MRHRIAAAGIACTLLVPVAAAADSAAFPGRAEMDAVRAYLKHREGTVSVALVDSTGRTRGIRARRRFVGASVVKAMLLVSYLRMVDAQGRGLAAWEREQLRPMIHRSSNRAATRLHGWVGDGRLRALARRARMVDFRICCRWTNSWFSARDQALLFRRLGRLTPRRFRPYALSLLRSIRPRQSWGIPKVARKRGFDVFHKPGWRPTLAGYAVHQAAQLRRDGERISLAVLSDGSPSYGYGIRTVANVSGLLLERYR